MSDDSASFRLMNLAPHTTRLLYLRIDGYDVHVLMLGMWDAALAVFLVYCLIRVWVELMRFGSRPQFVRGLTVVIVWL